MKKQALLLLSAFIAAALTGCGTLPGSALFQGTDHLPNAADTSNTQVIIPDNTGSAEGHLGDTMRSYFFDFKVSNAYLCTQYERYSAREGMELLVAQITVTNTFDSSIPMFDTDFQAQWNDPADDAYAFPVTFYYDTIELLNDETVSETDTTEDILPAEYTLEVNQSCTGLLVFEVPAGKNEFTISYLEEFDDDTTGDVFFVFLHDDAVCQEYHSGYTVDTNTTRRGNSEDDWQSDSTLQPDSPLYAYTCLYDFVAEGTYVCDRYGDYTPGEGMALLVTQLTITNTAGKDVYMFDVDFRLETFDGYVFPLTYYLDNPEILGENVLPSEYTLEAGEVRTGLLIFEIPQDQGSLYIAHIDFYEENGTGHAFYRYLPLVTNESTEGI